MMKYFLLLLFPLSLFGQGTKISDMTSATSLTGAEYVPIVQTTNKKATVSLLRGWSSIGTASQLLRVNAGATALEFFTPTWLTNPLTTTGDIIYSSSGTTGARLGIGGAGTFLRSDGSIPAWSTLTIPNTISALSIPVVNTANVLTSVTPSAGQSVRVNAGGTAWEAFTPGAGGGTPGGSDTEVQFNDGGSFGGDAGFVYNKTTNVGTIGGLNVSGLTSGELVATDGSKNLQSLAVATYPSLTELSYVKGLTSAAQTQLNDKWSLANGGTLTGANTITGTTTNILKGVFNSLGTTQTNGAGLWLANNTAAAAGAQQISPGLVLEGQGWKTNATAASQSVKTATYVLPIQQAANPFLRHVIAGSINGGAYYNMAYFESDGTANNTNLNFGLVTISNSGTGASTTITGNRYINFQTGNGPAGANYEYTFTGRTGSLSGAGGGTLSVGLASAYTQSSGSVGYTTALFNPSINVTSTYTGLVKGLSVQPSVTALASGATLIGYDYGVTGSPSGTNLSFRSTSGDMLVAASSYFNWGTTSGTSGYGLRDNSGTVEFKNSGGSWAPISRLLKATVTVSGGATLRGIGTTPVTLIAAPGSGFYLNIVSVALSYNFGTTQYDFGAGEDPCFKFNTTGGRWGFISQATINSGSDFNFTVHHGTNLTSSGGTVTPDNAAFILGTLNDGDATTGDGDIDIVIYYTIETTNN